MLRTFKNFGYRLPVAEVKENVNLDEWSNQGEGNIALQAFAEQFVELEKVM